MENKKQLVIIPPMSEAVKKLHDVLDSIANDENMEISIIDDLKEFTQFLGSTGQCLVLVSNAKKCAMLLQENRFLLAKHHCKAILFTPKEIPAKTLVKFTKIGLTESILESSAPKTFLYKVKLLLRSIKTAKQQDDNDKLIKAIETGKPGDIEKAVKEKMMPEENVIDMTMKKRSEETGHASDDSDPLKGNINSQEENIDTNWKSDRKKSSYPEASEDENMSLDSERTTIDMFYRGKTKKDTNLASDDADNSEYLSKIFEESLGKKKQNNLPENLEDESKKAMLLNSDSSLEEENAKKSFAEEELKLEKKKKAQEAAALAEMDLFYQENTTHSAPEKKAKKKEDVEDLDHFIQLDKTKEIEKEDTDPLKKEYDNSGIKNKDTKDFDLDLESSKKKNKKNNDEFPENEEETEGKEVDHIDGYMSGNAKTLEKIQSNMTSKTKKTDEENSEAESLDLMSKRKKQAESERERNFDTNPDSTKDKKEKNLRNPDEDFFEDAAKKEYQPAAAKDKGPTVELQLDSCAEDLKKEEDAKELGHNLSLKLSPRKEAEKNSKPLESSGQKKREDKTHNSEVDKLDSFYRGGNGLKEKKHDWSNLVSKDASLDLLPGQKKNNDNVSAKEKAELAEQTIDYRKLKEEFDLISRERISTKLAKSSANDSGLNNADDLGSFKVVEIDPKSLDFSIKIIDMIYQKDIKARQIFSALTEELLNNYSCYPVFYTYKLSDKKFTEVYNPFVDTIMADKISDPIKEWWNEYKKDSDLFLRFQTKSMTTWRSPDIIRNNEVWEDVELPTWAEQELKNKKVELIFPYFDGIDRMGMAIVFFPNGLDPKLANGLLTVLEMARTLFLDTIERNQFQPLRESAHNEEKSEAPEKKNVLSFFSGLFSKKKAG